MRSYYKNLCAYGQKPTFFEQVVYKSNNEQWLYGWPCYPLSSSSTVAVWRPVPTIPEALASLKSQSVFAEAIRMNPAGSIQMILDQYQDNPTLVTSIIGEKLMKRILCTYSNQ